MDATEKTQHDKDSTQITEVPSEVRGITDTQNPDTGLAKGAQTGTAIVPPPNPGVGAIKNVHQPALTENPQPKKPPSLPTTHQQGNKLDQPQTQSSHHQTGVESIPRDHPAVVHKDPSVYGKVQISRENYTIDITLNRHNLRFTADERQYMRECLKPDRHAPSNSTTRTGVNRHDFVDVTKADMYRCPLPSCSYRPINTKNLRQSIKSHCGAYHRTAYTYTYRFKIQGRWTSLIYPLPPTGIQPTPQTNTEGHCESLTEHAPTQKNTGAPTLEQSGVGGRTPYETQTLATGRGKNKQNKGPEQVKGAQKGRRKVSAEKGPRDRRSRLEPNQPTLMSWINARRLEKEVEERTASAPPLKDPNWGPFRADEHRRDQRERYDRNTCLPLRPGDTAPGETQDDWWESVMQDEQ